MADPIYGPNPQAVRPRMIPVGNGGYGGGYTQFRRRNNWYSPYVNMLYPPGFGNGFGNVQSGQRRGAFDFLIPQGFGGHLSNRDAFGRPIPQMQNPEMAGSGMIRGQDFRTGRPLGNFGNLDVPPWAVVPGRSLIMGPGAGFDRANIAKYRMR